MPDIFERFRIDEDSCSAARPMNAMNTGAGCPQFATQDTVFNPQNGQYKF